MESVSNRLDPTGLSVAVATPFRDDDTPDLDALGRHARWLVSEGVQVLMPCGTTGEGAALTADEQAAVIRTCVEAAEGKVPVFAGVSSSATRTAVELARNARRAGAGGLLLGTPAYNRPSQRGLLAHFRAVAEAGELPVVLYNVPGRSACNVLPETVLELAEEPLVVAVKESSGNLEQAMTLLRGRPPGFRILSGDDWLALPMLALGCDGLVSVAANQVPAEMRRMVQEAMSGDLRSARELHFRLLPLLRANFIDTNPVPLKAALGMLGRMDERVRLPLVGLSDAHRERVAAALREVGLLAPQS